MVHELLQMMHIYVTPTTFSPTCNRVVLTTKDTFVDEIKQTF